MSLVVLVITTALLVVVDSFVLIVILISYELYFRTNVFRSAFRYSRRGPGRTHQGYIHRRQQSLR